MVFLIILVAAPAAAGVGQLLPVASGVNSLVVDPGGGTAYVVNGSSVLVVDLAGQALTKTYPLSGLDHVDGIDPVTRVLALYGFSSAGIFDLTNGTEHQLLQAGAIEGAVIANGMLYAPSFNARVLLVSSLDGSRTLDINPYPTATEENGQVAGPCSVARSGDGSLVAFGDEFHQAVHVVRTSDNSLVQTHAIGFPPCRLFFQDNDTLIGVAARMDISGGSGDIGTIDLRDATSVPSIANFGSDIIDAAVDVASRSLFLLEDSQTTGQGSETAQDVALVDLDTLRITKKIPLGPNAGSGQAVAVVQGGATILVGTTNGVEFLSSSGTGGLPSSVAGCLQIDGSPLANGKIVVTQGRNRTAQTTDGSGCFEVQLRAGRARVNVVVPRQR
jgi:hypothetical protein